jgi:hypothetical protein
MQSEINIKIGKKLAKEYFDLITNQIQNTNPIISGIFTEIELLENLRMNCVSEEILWRWRNDYQEFLRIRRKLMAEKKFRRYYDEL